MKIGKQLFVGELKPSRHLMGEIKNRAAFKKPFGGIWTSTYINNIYGSDWIRWCIDADFNLHEDGWHSWVLVPKKDAKIFVIDSINDMNLFFDAYTSRHKEFDFSSDLFNTLDFELMKKNGIDAIHLTRKGEVVTRFGDIFGNTFNRNLYGWDCESTLWLNFEFEEACYIGKLKFT